MTKRTFASLIVLQLCASVLSGYSQTPDPVEIKCGTSHLSSRKGERVALALPGNLRDSIISPSGRFVIHYDATASVADSITEQAYAQRAALEADSAYDFEVIELGYPAPATPDGLHYHLYLTPKPYGAYGATVPVAGGELPRSPSNQRRTTSYIILDNRFTDSIYTTRGYDALRITIFHEFFHVIQFADYVYNTWDYPYFNELSSVWMEMLSTPEVPDYLNTIGRYLATLDLRFDKSPSGGYGQGIYLAYLTREYGPKIVRTMWERYSENYGDPVPSIESVLEDLGTTFCQSYMRFGTELVNAGHRFRGQSRLPDPQRLPVDQIVLHQDSAGRAIHIDAFALSLQYYAAGFGADSCIVVIARDTTRSELVSGTVTISGPGAYSIAVDDSRALCDTISCTPQAALSAVFPNPVVITGAPVPTYFSASRGRQPVNSILDIYSLTTRSIYHSEKRPTAFANTWVMEWNGADDSGKLVPSGEYIYTLNVDGEVQTGKFVVIRK